MKYLIFGTGEYYNRYKKWFERDAITALLDNAPEKQNTSLDGVPVVSPIQGIQMEYDAVMILSVHVKAMKQQLLGLGVPPEKIYHYYDLHDLICLDSSRKPGWYKKPIQYYGKAASVKSGILLLSHDLELGGPALALYHMAQILKKHGKTITVASEIDGPLREVMEEEGIPVVIDFNLQIETMKEAGWTDGYSLILCNTMNFYRFLSERNTEIPILWWLHDSLFFYDGVNREVMKKISLTRLKAVSVGPVPKEAILEFLPELECGELLYGVADTENSSIRGQKDSVFRFITIGFLEGRKGQDVLIQAIRKLSENSRKECEFLIVGQDKTLFGDGLRCESKELKEIIFKGSVNRETLHRLLDCSDMMICPSREDPMPTVAAEAMMHSVPCLLSDAVGTASYIQDGENGILFVNEDVQMLAHRIEWCIEHRGQVKEMGKRARELYEKYFSMQVFEKRLFEILDEMQVERLK